MPCAEEGRSTSGQEAAARRGAAFSPTWGRGRETCGPALCRQLGATQLSEKEGPFGSHSRALSVWSPPQAANGYPRAPSAGGQGGCA
jgi:hypothetical protein